jgi:hypothetical protein
MVVQTFEMADFSLKIFKKEPVYVKRKLEEITHQKLRIL